MSHPRSRRVAAVVIVGAGLVLTGCGSSAPSSQPAPATTVGGAAATPSSAATLIIKNFSFAPTTLTVSAGAKVKVTNDDSATHTVTASGSGGFDTGDIMPGHSATFTAPSVPGSYPYTCTIHQFMKGVLVVK